MAAIDDVTNLYVGYFNRAPDPTGLNFWVAQLNAGASLAGIAQSFSLVSEAQSLYSFLSAPLVGSPVSFLNSVYLNLFGRAIDAAGQTYWTAQLANPAIPIGRIIVDIISGAQGDDRLVVTNKTAVGKSFVTKLVDTNAPFNLSLAQNAFNGVTKDAATVTSATAANDAAITTAATAAGTKTFNLTAGTDIFVGSTGNDVFNGIVNGTAAQTFSSVDSLDGGSGTGDVLNSLHELGTGALFPNGPISNIEIFNVRNLAGAFTVNAGNFTGETNFNFDRSTAATTVVNLAAGTTVGIVGDGLTNLGASTIGFAGTEATSTLNISGGTGATTGAVTYTGSATSAAASPTALTINSTGLPNFIGGLALGAGTTSLTINAAANLGLTAALTATGLKTITASGAAANTTTGAAAVNLGTAAVAAGVTTIDASGLTAGGMAVILGAGVSSFKGGAGNDTVTSTGLSGTASIDAGAGTGDRVNIAATTDVDTAAEAGQYKGFEVLQAAGGVTVKVDDFTNSTIGALRTAGDSVVFNGVSQAQAAAVTMAATAPTNLTFNVNGAGVSGSDILNLTVSDGAAAPALFALGNVTAPNVEAINFINSETLTVASLTGATGLTSSTITGTGTVSITTGALALTSNSTFINASAVGGVAGNTVTIDASGATAFGISITGSSTYNNTITGTALADTLIGGAGNDLLINRGGAAGATAADLLTGMGGQDSFRLLGDIASGAIPAVYNTAARISDFGLTSSSATTDILQLSATAGNYTAATGLHTGIAVGGAGTTVVQSVAQNAAATAVTVGADLIKLSTGVVTTGDTVQVAFNEAIGTGTVTGLSGAGV
ncbi:MAG: DUF4214 domain-containing protein, partial [Pseudomonadota bacterium]